MQPSSPQPIGRDVTFNLADLFELVATEVPDTTAIVAGPRRLTYAQLDARAERLAGHLWAAGVGAGDFVGVQLTNGTEYLEAMLACFKVRAVPVNVNYRYVEDELRHLYSDAGLVGLVYHATFADQVGAALDAMAEPRVLLEVDDSDQPVQLGAAARYGSVLAAPDPGRPPVQRSGDDLYCVYTGGTTGLPKGVLWRHEDIFFAAMGGGDPTHSGQVVGEPAELAQRVLRPGIVALATPPLMHASAHWLAFSTFFGGGTLVLIPGGHLDAAEALRLVGAEHVNVLVIVGDAMAGPLLDVSGASSSPRRASSSSSLMAIGSGGALLSPATKRRLAALLPGAMVIDAFGSSETGQLGGSQVATDPYGSPRLQVDDRTAVLDERGVAVAAGSGEVGRLARGGHVPLRYHGDPDKSAATFIEVDGRRWALPGDLATVEADGTIVVLGRASQCINTGGEKVYPEEVEAALKEHPGVADVVVVAAADPRWGQRVAAVVAPRVGATPTLDDLRAHLEGRLAHYKWPRQLVLVDTVERSPSGKADYRWASTRVAADTSAATAP